MMGVGRKEKKGRDDIECMAKGGIKVDYIRTNSRKTLVRLKIGELSKVRNCSIVAGVMTKHWGICG